MLSPNSILQERYSVICSIGRGGMGAVYLAHDNRLGHTVALKETLFTDPQLRRAFEREARLLARLRHPALPKVTDHFEEQNGQFLVMDFITGDDLEILLAQTGRPFETERVLRWADQLLDALEYLHTQDSPIIHRDIKPANLKLSSRDQIILLDFGLAKGDVGLTTGASGKSVVGFTPHFASPEQIEGTGTDPRSDIYSLGATLYYLLTGVFPAHAPNRATARLNARPDPLLPANQIIPQIPSAVSDILSQSVELNPDRRPQTATAMREALIEAGRSSPSLRGSESQTLPLETIEPVLMPAIGQPPNTIPGPLPRVPFPQEIRPDARADSPLPSTTPPQFITPKAKKLRRLRWIVPGIALLIVAIIVILLVIGMRPKSAPQWEDTAANREVDRAAGVAARVNGNPIMLAEVERVIQNQAEGKQAQLSSHDLRRARLQVLDSMIEREALYQKAEREGLLPSEDQITAIIDERKREAGMSEQEFSRQLQVQNLTLEQLRDEARRDLAIKALQDKHSGKISISDQEVEDYYNANKNLFVAARGVRLAVIVADPSNNSADGILDDAKTDAEAENKIRSAYQQLQSGADFSTLARAKSEDKDSLLKGGDIGFFSEEDLKKAGFPEDLMLRFFQGMKVGDSTEPLQISSKWYVFKLMERRLTSENLTLASPGVRKQIAEELRNQRVEIMNAELRTTALNETRIINYLALAG